jgi:hypothetical protein
LDRSAVLPRPVESRADPRHRGCRLNLILGFALVHGRPRRDYIGIGAYAVGIPSYYDYYNGWLHLALARWRLAPRLR